MNPYLPPATADTLAPRALIPAMQVRYGKSYRNFLLAFAAVFGVATGGAGWFGLAAGLILAPQLVVYLWLAWRVSNAVYFEAFPDRLELVSPAVRRWRWKKPLSYAGTWRIPRWAADREDFEKFETWRRGLSQ